MNFERRGWSTKCQITKDKWQINPKEWNAKQLVWRFLGLVIEALFEICELSFAYWLACALTVRIEKEENEKEVCKIRTIEVNALFGEHGFIAQIEADDFDGLNEYVKNTIDKIPGVIATKTLTGKKI